MKVHYRHLIVATAAVVIALVVCLIYATTEIMSALRRESERIQKVEARQNELEVKERQEIDPIANRERVCSYEVVVCAEEKVEIKLQ